MLGILIKGLGANRVLWAPTQSGQAHRNGRSRRCAVLRSRADLQDKHDLEPLGPADGPVKNAIFGINAAGQYGIELDSDGQRQLKTTRTMNFHV